MLRRLYPDQPASFAFTPANHEWALGQITKYPEGRQASAVIPLLWRAQEQEGWVSRPAIEHVARMLDLAYIRVLEVATFYFMFQLQPVGATAHVQVCGTTSCMISGSEDLIAVCKKKISSQPHALSADGKFSWEEVECLGACANAPMAQIGKDYYEDLTAERLETLIDAFARGEVPEPGPQNGRFASEPLGKLTSLTEGARDEAHNASVTLALTYGDTVARITGPSVARVLERPEPVAPQPPAAEAPRAAPAEVQPASRPVSPRAPEPEAPPPARSAAVTSAAQAAREALAGVSGPMPTPARPAALEGPREGGADDLKRIKGVGPKLEALLHSLGFFHFAQIAAWTPAEIAWVDSNLEDFSGRATRDDWVGQAKTLATGGETEFSRRVDKGDVY